MSQLEADMATLIGLVRELPTRADLIECKGEILAKLTEFGTTVGGDVGRLLQRYEDLDRRVRLLEDKPNGAQRPRPARVR